MSLIGLSLDLGLGPQPEAILEPLRNLYQDIDRSLARSTDALALPCQRGCDACCKEAVFLSAPEFLLVAQYLLLHRSAAELQSLVQQMLALAERFADELELLESITGPERDEVAMRIKFTCPLLQDGVCSIYEARELNARSFGATWDSQRDHAYGCTLTHARLRVLPQRPNLIDARALRRKLMQAVPATEIVHVYPWWFARYGHHL